MPGVSRLAIALSATLAACAAAEAGARLIDGYQLSSPVLVRVRPPIAPPSGGGKWLDPAVGALYVARLPIADGVDRAWYALDPEERPATPVDPELERRYRTTLRYELPAVYEWNLRFARAVVCESDHSAHPYLAEELLHLKDVFVFEPIDDSPYPTYRFLRRAHYPSGLVTNSFGWRGPDVPMNKPYGRIRIAFVGASTTLEAHADRFSYPEYISRWLRQWAEARDLPVSFDVVNAAREGILSNSIEAIVRQELVPVRPDVIVYYEGANQFWPNGFTGRPIVAMFRAMNARPYLERYSALGARVRSLLDRGLAGTEPYKPPLPVTWPRDLSESDPPLDDPRLPVQLPNILHDLDRIRGDVAENHGTLMLSSFVWLVYPGMVLDRQRDEFVYRDLNERYWPFSYEHMRRFIDFQNRVFRKYAREHDLPFNDVAAVFPHDALLFVDSIHMTPAGVKLKAWVAFQNLVPILEQRLKARTLPSIDPGGRLAHPAFSGSRRLMQLDEIRRSCLSR
jgi:hypothetical protein